MSANQNFKMRVGEKVIKKKDDLIEDTNYFIVILLEQNCRHKHYLNSSVVDPK